MNRLGNKTKNRQEAEFLAQSGIVGGAAAARGSFSGTSTARGPSQIPPSKLKGCRKGGKRSNARPRPRRRAEARWRIPYTTRSTLAAERLSGSVATAASVAEGAVGGAPFDNHSS